MNKIKLISVLLVPFFIACNNIHEKGSANKVGILPDSLGFTNKAEAKNLMINGVKEGKWIEHVDSDYEVTQDTNAPYYSLTVYKSGKATGISHGYYKSRKLLFESDYTDGKLNGIDKAYYESGTPMYESPMVNGKANGVYKEYYLSGKLETEGFYTNDSLHVMKDYDENGVLYRETPYTFSKKDSCRIDGTQKTFYEDGKVREEAPYINSKINGVMKEYYESGKLKGEVNFINGKVIGELKKYYESGKLLSETPVFYREDEDYLEPNGVAKQYYESGKLKSKITYDSDEVVGMIRYNENGKLTEGSVTEYIDADFETTRNSKAPYYKVTYYKAGIPYGIEKWYYKSGKLESEVPYTNGKKNGTVKEYYEDGKLEYERPYISGKENGIEKRYYESGKIGRETQCINGKKGNTKIYDESGKITKEE